MFHKLPLDLGHARFKKRSSETRSRHIDHRHGMIRLAAAWADVTGKVVFMLNYSDFPLQLMPRNDYVPGPRLAYTLVPETHYCSL